MSVEVRRERAGDAARVAAVIRGWDGFAPGLAVVAEAPVDA